MKRKRWGDDTCGIYKITNTVNGKVYIGQSRNCLRRRHVHRCALVAGKHSNTHLQSAFNMHGEERLVFEIIELCDPNQLNEKEIYWIGQLGSRERRFGYNKVEGGYNGKGGKGHTQPHTFETRQRISEALSGRKASVETRLKQSKSMKGKPRSILVCPHCGKIGGGGAMSQWHFDNCYEYRKNWRKET